MLVSYDPETRRQAEKRLCSGEATLSQVWSAYEKVTAAGSRCTFRWLSTEYQKSPQYIKKLPTTQRDYAGYHRRICAKELADGQHLGDLHLHQWSQKLIRKYLDKRESEGAAVSGNREKAYISLVFSWAIERGHGGIVSNPAKGVRRITETARMRYVTDDEFFTALAVVRRSGALYLAPIMEIAYLLRARLCEVLDITRDDLREDGVFLRRRKGSRNALTYWSPRLEAAVAEAKALQVNRFNQYLIQGRGGDRLPESTVQTAWGRFMRDHWQWERFTIHDLKAKGVSDFDGNKQLAGGHKDPRMVAVYDRLPIGIRPTK